MAYPLFNQVRDNGLFIVPQGLELVSEVLKSNGFKTAAFARKYPDNLYRGEVEYTDYELGRFFSFLEEEGIFDKSLVIVTSDHGESLGQHGEDDHGFFIYEPAVWVPLMIRAPASFPVSCVEDIVELVDIAPTILDAMGLSIPDSYQGESLLPLMFGRKGRKKEIAYTETYYPWKELENNPGNFKASQNIAEYFRSKGRYREAIPFYRMTIKSAPWYNIPYFLIANYYFSLKTNLEEAIELCKKGIAIEPKDRYTISGCLLLARIYSFLGNEKEAKFYLDEAEKLKRFLK